MPQILLGVIYPIIARNAVTVAGSHISQAIYNECHGTAARNGIIVVVILVIVGIGNIAKTGPCRTVETIKVFYVCIIVLTETDISHIVNDKSQAINPLPALETIYYLPLTTGSCVGVETIKILQ